MTTPKQFFAAFAVMFLLCPSSWAQGVFTSDASGNWASSSTWTLDSGTDADGIPDSDDDVTIATGHAIRITSGSGVNSDKCNDLTIQGTGSVIIEQNKRLDVGANLTMSGTSSVNGDNATNNSHVMVVAGTFDVSSGATVTISDARFQVNGNTTLDGELSFSDNTGVKTFNGITVNALGNWNNGTVNEAFFIAGDIVNNGSWTGCPVGNDNCNYQFSANSALSGTFALDMSDIVINASVTVTNNATLTVNDRITGSGAFVNGATGTLLYDGSNGSSPSKFDVSTFTATATGNVVSLGGTDQDIPVNSGSYYDLTINGSDVGMDGNITVANQLSLIAGDINLGTSNLTLNSGATITNGSSSSYINASGTGVFRREISAIGSQPIPLGGANYSPITINLTAATLGSSPYLEFGIADSAHPNRDTDNTGASPVGDDDGTAATDYLDVYWTVSANDITSATYTATYIYDASDFTQSTESNMVGALYRTLSGGSTQDWLANGTVDASTNTVTLTDMTDFGDMYAMDNTLNRLPVELLYFEGRAEGHTVVLNWATSIEENNDYFSIERSKNARDYELLGYVAGAGNSQENIQYEYIDRNPLPGRAYYRLKQTDFNGAFDYSELIGVEIETSASAGFEVFPNPVRKGQRLKLTGTVEPGTQWQLLPANGIAADMALARTLTSSREIQLSPTIVPGLYLLLLHTSSGRLIKRVWIE